MVVESIESPSTQPEGLEVRLLDPSLASNRTATRRSAVISVYFFFAGFGWVSGTWVTRLAGVKDDLGISDSKLGIALSFVVIGEALAMLYTTAFTHRTGSGVNLAAGAIIYALALLQFGRSKHYTDFIIFVAWMGFGLCMHDMGMNAQGLLAELATKKNMLAAYHAFEAVGAVLGAATSALLTEADWSLWKLCMVTSICCVAIYVALAFLLYNKSEEHGILQESGHGGDDAAGKGLDSMVELLFRSPSRYIMLVMCVIILLGSIAEGSLSDWTTIYLEHYIGAGTVVGSFGYQAFQLTMAIGRLGTDRVRTRYGATATLKWGSAIAAVGLGIAATAYWVVPSSKAGAITMAIFGFGVAGIGVSPVVPVIISAVGQLPDNMHPTAPVVLLTACISVGLTIGPVLFGLVSDAMDSLSWSLVLDGVLVLIIIFLADFIKLEKAHDKSPPASPKSSFTHTPDDFRRSSTPRTAPPTPRSGRRPGEEIEDGICLSTKDRCFL